VQPLRHGHLDEIALLMDRAAQSLRATRRRENRLRACPDDRAPNAARGLLDVGGMARRSLFPREHGAYFQLAIPLIAAWLADPLRAANVLVGIAACLAFLAHEPLLVLLGVRGARLRRTEGRRALVRLIVLGTGALAIGTTALLLAPPATLVFAGVAGLLAVVLIALASRRHEHTIHGELIAAAALCAVSAIARVAAGASPSLALAWWLGWTAGFSATVIAVHRVLARHKAPISQTDRILGAAGLISTTALAVFSNEQLACLIAAPLVAASTVIIIAPPRATRLRAVGIAISAIAMLVGAFAALATTAAG
jgi:hypothetical protein